MPRKKKSEKLVQLSVFVYPESLRRAKALAREHRISMGAVIRVALARVLAETPTVRGKEAL